MANILIGFSVYAYMVSSICAISYNSVSKDTKHPATVKDINASFRASLLRESFVNVPSTGNNAQYSETSPTCLCSKIYDPVCSSDNKSFYNPCRLDCYAKYWKIPMTIKHQGNCIVYK